MASLYKVGKFYYVYCRYRGRRCRFSTGTKNKRIAELYRQNAEVRMAAGQPPWTDTGINIGSTVYEYLTYYKQTIAPSTYSDRARYLKRFVKYFGNTMQIREITRSEAMDYKAARLRSGAGSPVLNREMATIRHFFNYAKDRDLCDDNPFSRFKALPETRRNPRILSKEEITLWFKWCRDNDPFLYDLSIIAFYTGLRPSDTKKIRGSDVDVRTQTLTVKISKLRGTKTIVIPIHDDAREVLQRRKRKHHDGYLFPSPRSEHVIDIRRRVNRAREATGLTDFTFGQFRHNSGTYLISSGVDIYTVKEILGHASVKTTERYIELADETKHKAIDSLPTFDDHAEDKK